MTENAPPRQGPNPLRFVGLGVQLAASVVVGMYAGQWVDRALGGAGAIGAMIGALLGFGGTMVSLVRMLGGAGGGGGRRD